MVKQILLGIAVVGGEVFLDECMQLLGGGIAAGKVELAQGFYDPGIKREGLGMGVGEEESLEKLTQLMKLDLEDNPALTKAQIAELQKALHEVRNPQQPQEIIIARRESPLGLTCRPRYGFASSPKHYRQALPATIKDIQWLLHQVKITGAESAN